MNPFSTTNTEQIVRQSVQKYINQHYNDEEAELGYAIGNVDYFSDEYFRDNLNSFAENKLPDDRQARYRDYEYMSKNGYLIRSLNIYCNSAIQKDFYGNILTIKTRDMAIKKSLENLFYKKLNIDDKLWDMAYRLYKYGDMYVVAIPDSLYNPTHIKKIKIIDNPTTVQRIYAKDESGQQQFIGFYVEDDRFYFPYEIVHYRIDTGTFGDYGESIYESSRLPFKYYKLLKDFVVIYRMERGVEKSVVNVPVGNMGKKQIEQYINMIKNAFRKRNFLDSSGNLNTSLNPASFFERYYVPVRETGQAVTVAQIPAGQAITTLDDFRELRDEMIRGQNIPNAYLGIESSGELARASLAQLDINFARTIERLQQHLLKGMYKLAYIELIYSQSASYETYNNFALQLTPASDLAEKMEIEAMNARFGLVGTVQGTQLFPKKYILKKILKLPVADLMEIELYAKEEAAAAAAIQKAGGEVPMPSGGGGGGLVGTGTTPMGGSEFNLEGGMPGEAPMPEQPAVGQVPGEAGNPANAAGLTAPPVQQETPAKAESTIEKIYSKLFDNGGNEVNTVFDEMLVENEFLGFATNAKKKEQIL